MNEIIIGGDVLYAKRNRAAFTFTANTNTSVTLTVVSSLAGIEIGDLITGTGIPTGSRIGTISGTTVTMVTAAGAASNATTGGAQNLIFSSVYGSIVTVSLSVVVAYGLVYLFQHLQMQVL